MSGPLEYLPQGDEVWLFLVRKANGFLENEKGKQTRPYMVLLFEIAPHTVLYRQEVLTDEVGAFPSSDYVWDILQETMKAPRENLKQPPHRPKAVIFTSEKLFKELAKKLFDNVIKPQLWTEQENQGFGDEHVKLYSTKLREKQMLGYKTSALKPGLNTILQPKDREKTFYEATAELFKEAPWKVFNRVEDLFVITWPEAGTRIFFIYPTKEEIRLGIETSPKEVEHLFKNGERATLDESISGAYHRCLFYTDEFSLPFDDLYDVETNRFPLGADPAVEEFCYPFPIAFRKDMASFFRPPILDLEWIEVGGHVLAQFTRDWKQGKIQANADNNVAKKIEYRVPLFNRTVSVSLTYIPKVKFETLQALWDEIAIPDQQQVHEPSKLESSDHDPNACRVCKVSKDITLKRCGRCKLKLYCSRECQSKDWPQHQKICVPKE